SRPSPGGASKPRPVEWEGAFVPASAPTLKSVEFREREVKREDIVYLGPLHERIYIAPSAGPIPLMGSNAPSMAVGKRLKSHDCHTDVERYDVVEDDALMGDALLGLCVVGLVLD
ncbi:hypothetical protein A2U01_0056209, partial [Trifolium medium]|nr:hypothetical protein [Trifolium medium]